MNYQVSGLRLGIFKFLSVLIALTGFQFSVPVYQAQADNVIIQYSPDAIQANPGIFRSNQGPTNVLVNPASVITSDTRLIVQYYSDPKSWPTIITKGSQNEGFVSADNVSRALAVNNGRETAKFNLGKGSRSFYGSTWQFGSKAEASSAFQLLKANPLVKNVSYDVARPLLRDSNDTGYTNLGTLLKYNMEALQAQKAWDISVGETTTIVAVLDTGVSLDHPDLVANLWKNPNAAPGSATYHGKNFATSSINNSDPFNAYESPNDTATSSWKGHGTHVAGTIAGAGNNSLGTTGVSWKAQIMALRICDSAGCWTSAEISALDFAYRNGARVANASFGGYSSNTSERDAIAAAGVSAVSVSCPLCKGLVFVAAAGNDDNDNDLTPFYPAGYRLDNMIVVGALSSQPSNTRASFSNFGITKVDLFAPGESIYSTIPNGAFGYNCGTDSGGNQITNCYARISGTSMAAPHVAGIATLVASVKPEWTAQQIRNAIVNSTRQVPALAKYVSTGGIASAYNALKAAVTDVIPNPLVHINKTGNGTGSVTVNGKLCSVSDCVYPIASGSTVNLSINSADSANFEGWTGSCSGLSLTCSYTQSSTGSVAGVKFKLTNASTSSVLSSTPTSAGYAWSNARDDSSYYAPSNNFVNTALAGDGSIRVKAVQHWPSDRMCMYATSITGGVTIESVTASSLEAAYGAANYTYHSCLAFGNWMTVSQDGNRVAVEAPNYNYYDFTAHAFATVKCGAHVYTRAANGTWSEQFLSLTSVSDCLWVTAETESSVNYQSNFMYPQISNDGNTLFYHETQTVHTYEAGNISGGAHGEFTISAGCKLTYNPIAANSDATLLAFSVLCDDSTIHALVYKKIAGVWTAITPITASNSVGSSDLEMSADGSTLVKKDNTGVKVYEWVTDRFVLKQDLTTTFGDLLPSTASCTQVTTTGSRIICGISSADVGNNYKQGVIVVVDRQGSSWSNRPSIQWLASDDGLANDSFRLLSANSDGTIIDAGVSGYSLANEYHGVTYMGRTFVPSATTSITQLANVAVSVGSIENTFNPLNQNIYAKVPATTSSIRITPTVAAVNETVTVNGNLVTSGQQSTSIALTTSDTNTVTIVTTSADGQSQRTYYLIIGFDGLEPTISNIVKNPTGFTFNVTNYDSNFNYVATVFGGSITSGTPSGSTLPYTVSGLSVGDSSEVTITTDRTGYQTGSSIFTSNAVNSALIPTFGTGTSTSNGFTLQISNYDANFTWNVTSSAGTATINSSGLITVIGLSASQSATVTVTTTRNLYADGSAQSQSYSALAASGGSSGGSSGGGSSGGGGGGGGGGGPKQTAAYFMIVDPANPSNIYGKSACIDVYSTDLYPQFKGQGCSKSDGTVNLLLSDGGVTIRVYDAGYGSNFRLYHGKIENDVFTMDDAKFYAGTTRYAVSVPGAANVTPTPTPTPSPTPTPTPTPTPSPSPSGSSASIPTPEPSDIRTPAATSSPTPTAINSKLIPVNTYLSIVKSTRIQAISKSSYTYAVGSATSFRWDKLNKKSSVQMSITTPAAKTYKLPIVKITGTSYTSPALKFAKKGTYSLVISTGSVKRTVKVVIK